ncbi:cyclase/dehydrase [Segniliparus rotundus DSM 44985]|uniref:Cyclase/dehydrase n=1 Tax=Segniliparus rotundus (strain ATCC BAA-972 / CDC 1076 / CIP 108378 / DSM 44985 / JCM 13578) TaxID=640132 RepID=D6ZF16_SEGRD|nr:SRPBCC family protein [Segniliparus rotundus]ADG97540.1 cyclase/dehydrase [Segniliparus rotundus DSM 44985]
MADHTRQSIVIDAKPEDVMAVIADLDRYPDWVDAAQSVEILERDERGTPVRARFVLDAELLKDTYELRYTWARDGRSVRWTLLESTIMRSQEGAYILEPNPEGTKATYELSVDLRIPMLGLFRRKAERAIIDTALKELKKRVESLV